MENQAPKPLPADLEDSSDAKSGPTERSILLKRARETTTSPGVYLMKGQNSILYIGKAKNLKNRITSYFQSKVHEIPRIELFVSQVVSFDTILTETEAEALILEANLVRKHKPKFNIRLKDDKAYPYLKIQFTKEFPRIEWTRKVLQDGGRYFGPFPSAGSAREVLQLLNETFKLRDCSDNVFRHRSRPCILHQMDRCVAPCVQKITPLQYQEIMQAVAQVLEGQADHLLSSLRKEMDDAAGCENYEEAAVYRDQLHNLELIIQTQTVSEPGSQKDRDVVAIARKDTDAHGTILKVQAGKLNSVLHFHIQNSDASLTNEDILFDFLVQHYLPLHQTVQSQKDPEEIARTEVLLPYSPGQMDLLANTLGILPKLSEVPLDDRLLHVAQMNAQHALEQTFKEHRHGSKALEEIQQEIHLDRYPRRIECYDNSNIQGTDAVASRVVFIDGAPEKSLYRRYKIKTVEGANDFATMKEILGRRFKDITKPGEELPDLVVVDGGRGQLSQATAIFEELSIQGGAVVGLAKARTESNFQKKEVKSSHERIFIPNRTNPIPLHPHTGAYKLLTHIRDEAHRFAITYHRVVRSKRILGKK